MIFYKQTKKLFSYENGFIFKWTLHLSSHIFLNHSPLLILSHHFFLNPDFENFHLSLLYTHNSLSVQWFHIVCFLLLAGMKELLIISLPFGAPSLIKFVKHHIFHFSLSFSWVVVDNFLISNEIYDWLISLLDFLLNDVKLGTLCSFGHRKMRNTRMWPSSRSLRLTGITWTFMLGGITGRRRQREGGKSFMGSES